jgi:hypothetical protein
VIRIACPKCKTVATLPDAVAGKTVVCKCGQKISVPASAGPAPAKDDLIPQDLVEKKEEVAPPPSICPACKAQLPAGEEVCLRCGYLPDHLKRKKGDKKVVQGVPSRIAAWSALAQKPNPGPVDFITAAFSAAVWMTIGSLVGRGILAGLILFGGLTTLFILLYHFGASLPAQATLLGFYGVAFILWLVASGMLSRGPFALCQAVCFARDEARQADWPTLRTGFLFTLICLIPVALAGLVVAVSKNPVAGIVVGLLAWAFVVPITFLSASQAGGEWAGLSPARIGVWMGKLMVPYLGVVGLMLVDAAITVGITAIALKAGGAENLLAFTQTSAPEFPYGLVFALMGICIGCVLVSLHTLVYMSALLGMLYRKYEQSLLA